MIGKDIFKIDSKGKVRVWRIEVENLGDYSLATTIAGLADGEKIRTEVRFTEGKNIGRINETNHYEQALAEAESKYTLKLRKEYVKSLDDARQGESGSGIRLPMLAQKYSKNKKKGYKTLEELGLEGESVALQPKIDGNRCLIVIEENRATMWTRTGKKMPVQLDHILADVYVAATNGPRDLPVVLDGELYSDEVSFNTLNGLLKREKDNGPELEAVKSRIKYHLYDVMTDDTYSVRYNLLQEFESEFVKVLYTDFCILDQDYLDESLNAFIEDGHEGMMIRTLDAPYENKRSWALIKCKLNEDAEYECIDVEANVQGMLGAFILRAPDGCVDRDGKPIKSFKAGLSGISHEEGLKILDNPSDYVGHTVTVIYDSLSEYGIPRFPKVKGLRVDL